MAVTAIAARTRRVLPATRIAMVWGLGHMVTLSAVGGAIILFDWVMPQRVGLSLEFAVALALVIVGLLNLRPHDRDRSELERELCRPPARRAFIVGLVHGLAGSAAVALLVLATVRDPRWARLYLLVFGLGTLLGMELITTGLALPLAAAARRWGGTERVVRLLTGALSLGFGTWLIYHAGWHDGLFLAVAHWQPH